MGYGANHSRVNPVHVLLTGAPKPVRYDFSQFASGRGIDFSSATVEIWRLGAEVIRNLLLQAALGGRASLPFPLGFEPSSLSLYCIA